MNLHFGTHSVQQFPQAIYTPTEPDELPHPISGPVRVIHPPARGLPVMPRRPIATPISGGSGSASVTPPTYYHITQTPQQPRGILSRFVSGLFS
jgi:hypothetical protein